MKTILPLLLVILACLCLALNVQARPDDLADCIAICQREALAKAMADPAVMQLRFRLSQTQDPKVIRSITLQLAIYHLAAVQAGRAAGHRRHAEIRALAAQRQADLDRDNNFARALRGEQ